MNNPLFLLLILLLAVSIITLAIIFKNPLKKYWNKINLNKTRVLVEDALKHLYDYEYKGIAPTLESLAGALSISPKKAGNLIEKLIDMGLLAYEGNNIKLTSEGRIYALKIVRIHRLWERYLAEETSVPTTEWHAEAEFREHKLSDEEVEKLSARLGNPLIDPHGDPIPSPKGEMPEKEGMPLTNLKEGDYAKVVHVEDEPPEVYEQISAYNILPGIQIRIVQKDNKKIIFDAEGQEAILALRFAQNITVIPLEADEIVKENFQTLNQLEINNEAEIIGISNSLIGQQRRRLLDFGFVPGSKIKAVLKAAGNDPTAYLIRDTMVALRENIASKVFISPEVKNDN